MGDAEVLTVLVVHTPVRSGRSDAEADPPHDPCRAALSSCGGTVLSSTPATTVATFHIAGDAATAARRICQAPSIGEPGREHASGGGPGQEGASGGDRPRIALATGEVAGTPGPSRGPALDRAHELAQLAGPGQILVSGTTAVMVSHALPPDVELVDLGPVTTREHRGERVHELRSRAASSGPATGATPSNLGWAHRAASGVVVGREHHLGVLEGVWERALAGDRRMVVLSGDPGIGKTTLAAELALRLHAQGAVVLYGRWDEQVRAPYQAVREALGGYAATCPRPVLRHDLGDRADEIARLLPDIGAAVGGVRAALTDDPDAERQRLFDAVSGWLDTIAARQPLVLVLDDLQWADRSSLLLGRHLLEAPGCQPVLVVVTLRDGDVEGMGPLHELGLFEARDAVERLDIEGLAAADVERLVEHALGRPVARAEADLARWLADETAGNPLFVQEILRGVSGVDAADALHEVRERLPERLHDVIRWRLGALDDRAGEVLAAASFLGEEFSLGVLAEVAGVDPHGVRDHLDEALRAGLVRDATPGHMAFPHAVVRRALQDELPPRRAVDLHRRIAEVLATRVGDEASAAEVAHHHLCAADETTAATAIRWARTAADQARRETAFENSVWFLARAVDVHDRFGDDDDLAAEMRLELAEAHDRAGEFTARDRRHLEAAALASASGRTDLLVRSALGYGGRLPATPPPSATGRGLLDEVLARLPDSDGRARALATARLAHLRHLDAPHAERARLSGAAVDMARRLDAPVVLASALVSRCLALDGPDDVDEQLEIGAEVIRIGEQTGDPDLVLQGARTRIQPLLVVGAHEAAHDLAERFTRLAGEVRHPDHQRLVSMWQIMWSALAGRFADALGQSDVLRERLGRAGHSQAAGIHLGQTLPVLWMQGELDRYRRPVEAIRGLPPYDVNGWATIAWVEAAGGRLDTARTALAQRSPAILAELERNYFWTPTMVACAITAATTADDGWARAAHTALAPYAGRNCVAGYAAYLGAVDHHLGALDTVLGRYDDAVEHLEAARRRHRTIGARPFEALSSAWLANALAGRHRPGDAARAVEHHRAAVAMADELGVRSLPAPHPALPPGLAGAGPS